MPKNDKINSNKILIYKKKYILVVFLKNKIKRHKIKHYMIVNIMVLFSCLWVSSHCNILSAKTEEKVLKTFIFKRKVSDWAKNSVSDDQQKKTK